MESRFPILNKFKKRYYMRILCKIRNVLFDLEHDVTNLVWVNSNISFRSRVYDRKDINFLMLLNDVERLEKKILDKNKHNNT